MRLNKKAGVKKIAEAIRKVVENPDYQTKAKQLSIKIRDQGQWQKACEEMGLLVCKALLHKFWI